MAWKQSAEDAQEEAGGADAAGAADGAMVPTGVSDGEVTAPPATSHDDDDGRDDDDDDDDDDVPPDPGASW